MVTDYPADDAADGVLPMPCNDLDPHFSFTSCAHTSSHGFVCTTTSDPHENQESHPHLVYPSPPPTNSQPKRNVPLPFPGAARNCQYQYGGILDSPVVLMSAPTPTPLSPPPTIPTPTHALPPSDAHSYEDEAQPFSSLLQPIPEHESPRLPQTQLLSPISPEWTTHHKPEEDLFGADDSSGCVLMSQPHKSAYDYAFAPGEDDDVLAGAPPFGRPALRPLDIPMYEAPPNKMQVDQGVLLGFPGVVLDEGHEDDANSPFEFMPPSPFSPICDLDFSESDLDGLDLDMDLGTGPSSYTSPSLRSFASLPSPDLDDLDLDMDLCPGIGMSPSSPSRRYVASLPSFDASAHSEAFPDFDYSPSPYDTSAATADTDLAMSSPDAPPSLLPTPHPSANALLLDLPAPTLDNKPPALLDTFSPEELVERLPPGYPLAELEGLLAVRRRAGVALAAALSSSSSTFPSAPALGVRAQEKPRDSGEPRRRRKRAKELGREVDALVGLVLGLLPAPTSAPASSAVADVGPGEVDVPTPFPGPASAGYFDAVKKRVKAKARADKAGLAGSASVPALVARMILRRRERCVRGLAEGGGRTRGRAGSPQRCCFSLEGDEPPPTMDVDADGGGQI
ncbi:hypothetical protein B0H10DRAFT_984840 [Mycena sp. CBHHK59/15]|nr:hypothetical protein B0H10DRAFT_984840 [Mycena sp. CBHHK59/15]